MNSSCSKLLIEPFCTGSHKQLIDLLHREIPGTQLYSLPGKKWHWKARTSALWFSQTIPQDHNFRVLFTSSVLNLAELVALRPDLAGLKKVVYFHENQLVYPVRKQQEKRDFQFGYNQILTSMVADVILFNSKFNMDSFLSNINSHLKLIPDYKPKKLVEQIKSKCQVLHYPILFPDSGNKSSANDTASKDCNNSATRMSDDTGVKVDKFSKKDPKILNEQQSLKSDQKILDIPSKCESDPKILNEPSNYESGPKILNEPVHCESDPMILNEHSRYKSGPKILNESSGCELEDVSYKSLLVQSATEGDVNEDDMDDDRYTFESQSFKVATDDKEKTDTPVTSVNTAVDGIYDGQDDVLQETPVKRSRIMEKTEPLHIVWPHRWEHDKDPETFFKVLTRLSNDGLDFRVSVLGELYSEIPEIFEQSKVILKEKILNWGFLPSKEEYYQVLQSADCVVSTAKHEFFGVAMLEAAHLGCYPLCPNKLVYPEIFPKECLYNTEQQLYKRLREFCRRPHHPRSKPVIVDTQQFSWETLRVQFLKLFDV